MRKLYSNTAKKNHQQQQPQKNRPAVDPYNAFVTVSKRLPFLGADAVLSRYTAW